MKYLKWVYGNNIMGSDGKFEIGKVMVCDKWYPNESDWQKRGGFNFSNEENILRWIARGDTLYDVIIPEDAEVINVKNYKTPNGIYVSNKIVLKNPRKASDELTLDLYKKSNMPEDAYFETIGALAIGGCYKTCLKIIEDKVNKGTIYRALDIYKNFIKPWHEGHINYDCYNKVLNELEKIKNIMD